MEDAITMWPTLTLGVLQDGTPLPNSVPGIDSGTPTTAEGQAAPGGGGIGGTGTQPTTSLFNSPMFLMLGLVMVFMIFTTMMSSRREKKKAANMMASLKRGDKVLTLGGMIGTIHELRDDSIVLRVDDVSGAKAHFTRNAIQRVLKSAKSDNKIEEVVEAS